MAKLATALSLTLPPRLTGTPAYRWLYDALRDAILAGRLRPGAQLPSSRDVATRYGLARGTVVSPAPIARQLGDGHELDTGDAEVSQIGQLRAHARRRVFRRSGLGI